MLFEYVFKFEPNFLKLSRAYVFDINGLLALGHELFSNISEDIDVSLGVGSERFHDDSVVFLAEEGVEVLIDDFKAARVFICDFLLN